MKRPTKQQQIDTLTAEVARLRREAELFNERLNEARRRTIPYGDGVINFLPLAIREIRQEFPPAIEITCQDGWRRFAAGGQAETTIVVDGLVFIKGKY